MKRFLIILAACGLAGGLVLAFQLKPEELHRPKPSGRTLQARFAPPPGFHRIEQDAGSFGAWLRNCPLKPEGTQVRLFDGRIKPDEGVYAGVLDFDIGTADLQQCADAVMRLRAEYLWNRGNFGAIGFHLTNGFYADYQHWRDGYRIVISGNAAKWVRKASADAGYAQFRKYLETVFAYAGTRSLERELHPVAIERMQPGDVFIRGGSPGHAVLVMDMAVRADGKRCFLLSQSYMPAQDIQILRDPGRALDGIWYALPTGPGAVPTPEWDFTTAQLRRFP